MLNLSERFKSNQEKNMRRKYWIALLTIGIFSGLVIVGSMNPAAEEAGWISLFDGKTLDGWEQINGTAKYEAKDGTIVGTTAEGSPNSFLCTKKHYSDFELEFEVKVDNPLNSGVQIRSNSMKEYRDGRVHGYQVEIAADGFSGFIYDEARRDQWLCEDRCDKQASDEAFKKGEWNQYRVICLGDSIKTWINGKQIADVTDSMTKSGFIGLQVHAYKGDAPAQVRWRNIRIKELKTAAK